MKILPIIAFISAFIGAYMAPHVMEHIETIEIPVVITGKAKLEPCKQNDHEKADGLIVVLCDESNESK